MSRSPASLLIVVSTLLVGQLLTSAVAMAAPGENPEALIRQGVELRRKGQDTKAEGYFRRAYELAATPRTAAQLGLVELALKRYAESEAHLSEALRTHDAWVVEYRPVLDDSRDQARAHLVRLQLTGAPKGTTFKVAGAEAAPLPADGVLWLAPETASLDLEAAGYQSASIPVGGTAGETRKVAVELLLLGAPPPAPVSAPIVADDGPAPLTAARQDLDGPPAAPARPGKNLRVAGIAVGAGGVVAGTVGLIFLSQAQSKVDAINSAGRSNGAVPYDPANGNFQSLRTAGTVFVVGGTAALLGGAALYYYGRKAGNAAGPDVALSAGAGFGAVMLRGAF